MDRFTVQGHRIVERRNAVGLTQEKLAAQVGVTRNTVARWEKSEGGIDGINLMRLAKILGVTADSLLVGKDEAAA